MGSTPTGGTMIECKYCDKKYRYRGWYYKHIEKKHPKSIEGQTRLLFRPGLAIAMRQLMEIGKKL